MAISSGSSGAAVGSVLLLGQIGDAASGCWDICGSQSAGSRESGLRSGAGDNHDAGLSNHSRGRIGVPV